MSSSDDDSITADNVIANMNNPNSRNSESGTYGEDFYSNPFTNPEYEKTLQSLNVDKLIYDLAAKGTSTQNSKSLVTSAKSLPFVYEGHNVLQDVIIIQGLSIPASSGMETPQFFSEPGYLVSFRVAVNDPLMALKVEGSGVGSTQFDIADYSMRKMAALGMGMTLGEAEEIIYTDEGETSRDVSGTPSMDSPYLVRYKHLPTGTETDYDLYKGTFDDVWIVAAYNPKLIPKFNSLYFDIFNANTSGPRLVHYLEIKRLIIVNDRLADTVPKYNESILSLPIPGNDLSLPDSIPPETASSSYARRKNVGRLTKVRNDPFLVNPSKNIFSINKDQQKNNSELFKDIMDVNHEMFNDLIRAKFQQKNRLKRVV